MARIAETPRPNSRSGQPSPCRAGRGAFCRPEPHIVSMEPKFADWEGIPARWVPGEAWAFIKSEWVEVDDADVGMNAAELDEESFFNVFGRLMALPAIAFQGRPDRWTASR